MSADWDESREQRTRRTIFVGNLHSNVTTGELRRHIESGYGLTIAGTDIVIERGYALVTVPTEADAARVVAGGLRPLANRPLLVESRRARDTHRPPMWATQSGRLAAHVVLGNVPRQASDSDVELHVTTVAPVVTVGLPRARDGSGRGVAFVVLKHPDDAPRVVAALDGLPFQGRALRATLARS